MREIGIGVIGAGGISDYVHIPGLLSCPGTRIVSVCDSNVENARRLADKYGLKGVSGDYNEVLHDTRVDGVVIATPNVTHARIAQDALKAGKHVLLEKPVGMNGDEARGLLDALKMRPAINMVAFNYRFIPALRYMKQLVDHGELGTIYHIRAFYLQQWPLEGLWNWRCEETISGTGHLGDLGSHLVDFARFLVGEFRSVMGSRTILVQSRTDPDTGRPRTCTTDDAAQFLAKFENGASGIFDMTRYAPGRGCRSGYQFVELNGSRGTAVYEFQAPEIDEDKEIPHDGQSLKVAIGPSEITSGRFRTVRVPAELLKVEWSERRLPPVLPFIEPRYDQAQTFVHGIRSGQPVSPDFYDGVKAMEVLDAVVRSAAEGKEVHV